MCTIYYYCQCVIGDSPRVYSCTYLHTHIHMYSVCMCVLTHTNTCIHIGLTLGFNYYRYCVTNVCS